MNLQHYVNSIDELEKNGFYYLAAALRELLLKPEVSGRAPQNTTTGRSAAPSGRQGASAGH